MSQDVEQRIRERAYAIWQDKGCPEGCDHEHWYLAEQEIAGAAAKADGEAPKAAAGRKTRARKAAVTA